MLIRFVALALFAVLSLSLVSAQSAPQRCTRIRLPESTHFPIEVLGQRTTAPVSVSAAFKPVLSTVELPTGYHAVGGGDQYVVACTR